MASRPNRARLLIALLAAVSLVAAVLLAPAIGATDPGAVVAKKKKGKGGANKPISGKLDKSGYTVIALSDASTNASAVKVTGRKFKVPIPLPPGKKTKGKPSITLHLRAPDGTYAGPVVLAGRDWERPAAPAPPRVTRPPTRI